MTGVANQKYEGGTKLAQYDLPPMNLEWNPITDEDNGSTKLVYAYFELDLGYISIPKVKFNMLKTFFAPKSFPEGQNQLFEKSQASCNDYECYMNMTCEQAQTILNPHI
jgi:hypothetical protein